MSLDIQSIEDYHKEYKASVDSPMDFWAEKAEQFVWHKKWDNVLEWDFEQPSIKWFEGGQLNITENCIDRHLKDKADKPAIIWEANSPEEESITLTYQELHDQVCQAANMLKSLGVQKGDRVCMYMPMIPQLAISCLACARIGAIHSVIFAGFSANALADRINDAKAKVVITSDGAFRGKKNIVLKEIVDTALTNCESVKHCVVYQRTNVEVRMVNDRDLWWHEAIAEESSICKPTPVDAEDILFILYTSGSTGQPKGVVHTTAGYMVYTDYSFRNAFQYKQDDIYWCTADIGWITGHSYIIYGPLLAGATSLMFEGVPTFPDAGRFWQIVEKQKVNIFYTAPTAIRALEKFGTDIIKQYDLSSLKVLGSVGEPINVEAWEWYHQNIGNSQCPIVDTYWQTETGGFMISPIAGITKEKASFATLPLPGIQPVLLDNDGNEIEGNNVEGNLCFKFPWPSMLRTTYGDHERCKQVYFSTFKGYYFSGDGCKRDEEGYYKITGRVDDVINVSGHRMGTAEVENALDQHQNVVEAAVVGFPHPIKGQGIYAYVICHHTPENEEALRAELLQTVTKEIGPIAKPDKIQVVPGLPKTRSGKIMRRILRKVAEGDTSNLGDISTLLDPSVVEVIKEGALQLS